MIMPSTRDPAFDVIEAITPERLSPADIVEWAQRCIDGNKSGLVCCVNPRALWLARRDPGFVRNLQSMDRVIVDGIGLVWLFNRLKGRNIDRVSFETTSLSPPVFKWCEARGHAVHFIGAEPGIASKAADAVREHFPRIRIVAADHGFLPLEEAVARVRASGARVVAVGMGAPQQEKFMVALRESGWSGVAFNCGGYLDQLAYAYVYFPNWINRLHLRFLLRIFREPRRIGHRVAIEYQTFYAISLRALFNAVPKT